MSKPALSITIPAVVLIGGIAISFAQKGKQAAAAKPENAAKVAAALPESAPAKPKKARKVLIFSKTAGFRHKSIPTGVDCLQQMATKTKAFEVTATEDEAWFEPEKLKEFDAVVFLNTTGEVFKSKEAGREDRLKKSLLDFVNNGGGLVGMHSATDTYKNWKEFNDMMGGAFAGHPWHTKIKAKNLEPDHPLMAGFEGKDIEVADEIYQFREDTASPAERRMLLSLSGDIVDKGKGNQGIDGFYPIAWLDEYGKGRVFYCSLGHRDEIFWNPAVLKHYLAGIQYATGDLEADAEPKKVAGASFLPGTKFIAGK